MRHSSLSITRSGLLRSCASLAILLVPAQGFATGGYCANRHSEVSLAVCEQNTAKLQVLIDDQGIDVNAPDEAGQTPLAVAFHSGSVYWMPVEQGMGPVIQLLLDRGANPNKPVSANGTTALHEAAYTGNMVLTEALVKAGANVLAVNDAGVTPTQEAASCDFRLNRDDCPTTGCDQSYAGRWRQGAKPVIAYLASKGAPLDQKLLASFGTPCADTPALCTKEAIETAQWPTGYCKNSYLFVKHAVAGAHQ